MASASGHLLLVNGAEFERAIRDPRAVSGTLPPLVELVATPPGRGVITCTSPRAAAELRREIDSADVNRCERCGVELDTDYSSLCGPCAETCPEHGPFTGARCETCHMIEVADAS